MTALQPQPQSQPVSITPDLNLIPTGHGYHIQRLLPRHFKILELRLTSLNNKEIATALNCTRETVGIVIRSPLFQSEYQRRLADRNSDAIVDEVQDFVAKARRALENNSLKAAQTQIDLLESADDSVRLRSSGSILDRVLGTGFRDASGGPGGVGGSGANVHIHINTEDAKLILIALRESKEFDHAERDVTTADSPSAGPTENGQGDVHQAT